MSQKRCVLGSKLLKNTNRNPYTIYSIVPLSMTSEPSFKVTTFFEVEYCKNSAS